MRPVIIVAIVLVACICLIFWYILSRLSMYNRFQRDLKVGDRCIVYINDERTDAVITAIFESLVIVEDCLENDSHSFPKWDIYPPLKKINPCTSKSNR